MLDLPCIPLATIPCPVRMSNSPMAASRHGLERHLFSRERLFEIRDYHKSEAERYAEGWQLREAA